MNATLSLRLCIMLVPQAAAPAAKRLRSSQGLIYDTTKCVWCCKAESAKHRKSKLCLNSYDQAWAAFKSQTVAMEDHRMRSRINCLIDSAADQPYTLEIRYHPKYWMKYVRCYQNMSEDDKLLRDYESIIFRYEFPRLGDKSSILHQTHPNLGV